MTVDQPMSRIESLCRDVKRDIELLWSVVILGLEDELLRFLTPDEDRLREMRTSPDGRAQFWRFAQAKTGRTWSYEEVEKMWAKLRTVGERGVRKPIKFVDWLRLYWNTEERCAYCGKAPPEVELEKDHIEPVKRHGSSSYTNLRFLCVECNRLKAAKPNDFVRWEAQSES